MKTSPSVIASLLTMRAGSPPVQIESSNCWGHGMVW